MASDQNQNQTASGGDTRPPSTLAEINEERLRKKVELGKKIAEQSEGEKVSEMKTETISPQTPKAEIPVSAPIVETAPAPDNPLAAMQELQRQKAEAAIEEQDQAETKLSEIKEEVSGAREEADRTARKVIDNARLTELRTERDNSGRSIESARRAENQAGKAEEATEDLKERAQDARKQGDVVKAAKAKAEIEIKRFQKLDAYNQKRALEELKKAG
ncbi:hypothetical protein COT68_00690 [bacterium (Candidatus Torokbacteria) CG09_land_8_20_14_0_10_42_11]|nr:MAG: hypothetical protein COT68_00690 [bacterium (Candidatus Torokbacteria) CG09_land_8_20_14_0_10_42_11]